MSNTARSDKFDPSKSQVVKKSPPNYLKVLDVLEEGPLTTKELVEKTGIKEETLEGVLSKLRKMEKIKNIDIKPIERTKYRTEKHKIALKSYRDKDEQIIRALKDFNIQELSDEEFAIIIGSQWKVIASLAGLNPDDPRSFDKLMEIAESLRNKKV